MTISFGVVMAAAEKLVAGALPSGADWPWVRQTLMRQIVGLISHRRGLRVPWPMPPGADVPIEAADVGSVIARLDTDGWGMPEVSELYEALCERDVRGGRLTKGAGRKATGTYYTPPQVASGMVHLSLTQALEIADEKNPDDPAAAVLAVRVIDPTCGAGVFLVEAARWLAAEHDRRGGTEDLASVIVSCCHGVDRDPVAVDLTKTALWWEVGGRVPITWIDRNVIVGDVLEGDLPPAFAEVFPNPPEPVAEPEPQSVPKPPPVSAGQIGLFGEEPA